ncbi:MAG: nucleoside triphosphate pyrophosphohydrolase [Lentisphaerae bacterium]|nr:nucleoside triphosphate pyrophosphohydrolase [Lentisphaerota bacterium]
MDEIDKFVDIVRQLRAENGCPWDRAQTHLSLRRCLVEETGEFLDAVEDGDYAGMQEELGDLLLQVILHAQIADEDGRFTLQDVAAAENAKLLRRHPHVFGEQRAGSPAEALRHWEASKASEPERSARRLSAMDGIPRAVPGLSRAQKTLSRAGKDGFEWPRLQDAVAKVEEELGEVKAALAAGDAGQVRAELGDLLLAVVNLCRWQSIEAEEALQEAVSKFMRRYRALELLLAADRRKPSDCSGTELLRCWQAVKKSDQDTLNSEPETQ